MAAHNLLDAMSFISATCEAFITYTALNNNPASLSIFNLDRYPRYHNKYFWFIDTQM